MSTLTVERKRAVLQAGSHTCALSGPNCTVFATTVDHWVPRARGGSNNLFNLQPACKRCNHDKGHLMPDEWLEFVAAARDSVGQISA